MDLDKFTGTDEYASHEKQKLDDLKVQEIDIDHNIEEMKASNEDMERMLGSIKVAINKTHKDLELGVLTTDSVSEKDGAPVKRTDAAPGRASSPIVEISDANMMQYLGIIEQQLTEITLAHSYMQRREGTVVHGSTNNVDRDQRDLGMASVKAPRLPNVDDEGYSSDEVGTSWSFLEPCLSCRLTSICVLVSSSLLPPSLSPARTTRALMTMLSFDQSRGRSTGKERRTTMSEDGGQGKSTGEGG